MGLLYLLRSKTGFQRRFIFCNIAHHAGSENSSSKSPRNISTFLLNYTASHPEDGYLVQIRLWALELPKGWGISLPAEWRSASQQRLNLIA
jgi:hypothetical protein